MRKPLATIVSTVLLVTAVAAGISSPRAAAKEKKIEPPPTRLEPGEPAYCDFETFRRAAEKVSDDSGLEREHVFRLGKVVLVGLAIGESRADDVRRLAEEYSSPTAGAPEKHCTWYLNEGRAEPERLFNWDYVENPKEMDPEEAANQYMTRLNGIFDSDPTSVLSCAREHGYIAIGCNAMKHRGPVVIGMLLAYTGCTPQHALDIVSYYWGSHGVSDETRAAVVRQGYEPGRAHASASAKLRALLTTSQ